MQKFNLLRTCDAIGIKSLLSRSLLSSVLLFSYNVLYKNDLFSKIRGKVGKPMTKKAAVKGKQEHLVTSFNVTSSYDPSAQ